MYECARVAFGNAQYAQCASYEKVAIITHHSNRIRKSVGREVFDTT